MSEAETTFRKMSEVRPRDRVAAAVTGPYREGTLDGARHWLQEERAAEVSAESVKFLAG